MTVLELQRDQKVPMENRERGTRNPNPIASIGILINE